MARKTDPDEVWCGNVPTEEWMAFWENWCAGQWGMPTFRVAREVITRRRAKLADYVESAA